MSNFTEAAYSDCVCCPEVDHPVNYQYEELNVSDPAYTSFNTTYDEKIHVDVQMPKITKQLSPDLHYE